MTRRCLPNSLECRHQRPTRPVWRIKNESFSRIIRSFTKMRRMARPQASVSIRPDRKNKRRSSAQLRTQMTCLPPSTTMWARAITAKRRLTYLKFTVLEIQRLSLNTRWGRCFGTNLNLTTKLAPTTETWSTSQFALCLTGRSSWQEVSIQRRSSHPILLSWLIYKLIPINHLRKRICFSRDSATSHAM